MVKVRIEFDNSIVEDEITIKCQQLNKKITDIQNFVNDIYKNSSILFYKDNKEYYLNLNEILFFETNDNQVLAHTTNDVFVVKYKLYELEELIAKNFMRISKSTIINIDHIYSITKNITTSNLVEFYKSHKQVYVSRFYYKSLRKKLEERRK